MSIDYSKLPIFKSKKYLPSDSLILNLARYMAALLRVLSPNAWIVPFFQIKTNGKSYVHPKTTEIYLICALLLPVLFFICTINSTTSHLGITVFCVLLGVESIQYQFWNVVLRPEFEKEYKVYSASRTLIIVMLQYFQIAIIYAIVYKNLFPMEFAPFNGYDNPIPICSAAALEFSLVTITTVGYGSISANPGSAAALVATTEALVGVFSMGMMLSISISRLRAVAQVKQPHE